MHMRGVALITTLHFGSIVTSRAVPPAPITAKLQ
jgi:hypothetical protein